MRLAGIAALVAAGVFGCATSAPADPTPEKFADMFGVWSPDGEMIAFVSDRTGDPEIYVARRDGSGLKRLTDAPGRDAHPFWFPDGDRIAFQSPRNGGDVRIFVMNADGSGQRELAPTQGFCGVPTVAPDGERIAYMCSDSVAEAGEASAPWRLYLINADGSGLRRISDGPGNDQVANWSPGGESLVFWSNRSGADHIYAMEVASGALRQLTDGSSQNRAAVYSPDGSRILFLSDRDGGWALYEMPSMGGAVRRLAGVETEFGVPYASPDGSVLTLKATDGGPRIAVLDPATGLSKAIDF